MKHRIYSCLLLLLLVVSCEEIISVPDITEDIIEVIAPINNASLEEGPITFSWSELEFADQYQLQVATPTFSEANQVVLDTIIGDSIQSFRNLTTSLGPSLYQWRIRGVNTNFQTAYATQNLEVFSSQIPLSDQVITLLSPEDNIETSETSITFSWEALEMATQYRIIITNTTDNSVVTEQSVTETEITLDLMSGNFQWSVRAENDQENSPYSSRSLTIL